MEGRCKLLTQAGEQNPLHLFSRPLHWCTTCAVCCTSSLLHQLQQHSYMTVPADEEDTLTNETCRDDTPPKLLGPTTAPTPLNTLATPLIIFLLNVLFGENRSSRITGLMPRARLTCARPTRCAHCYVYESSSVVVGEKAYGLLT